MSPSSMRNSNSSATAFAGRSVMWRGHSGESTPYHSSLASNHAHHLRTQLSIAGRGRYPRPLRNLVAHAGNACLALAMPASSYAVRSSMSLAHA